MSLRLSFTYAFLAVLAFSCMSIFTKLIPHTISNSVIVFFRFGMGFLLLLPWVVFNKNFNFRIEQPFLFIIRNITGLLSISCLFFALRYIPLVDALLLANTFPLFVPLVARVFGTHTSSKIWLWIIIGFMGIALVLKPGHELFHIASLISLLGGFCAAISIVLIRQLSSKNSTSELLFYFFLTCTIIPGFFVPFNWTTPSLTSWLLLLGVGIFGTFYQVFLTKAYSFANTSFVAPTMYFTIILGGLSDWLIWNHKPDVLTIIGSIIVIISGIVTIYLSYRHTQSVSHSN